MKTVADEIIKIYLLNKFGEALTRTTPIFSLMRYDNKTYLVQTNPVYMRYKKGELF